MAKNLQTLMAQLGNPKTPITHRSSQLIDVLAGAQQGNSEYKEIVEEIFAKLQEQAMSKEALEQAAYLDEIMQQLKNAPLRPATFMQLAKVEKWQTAHAMVSMDNGEIAYVISPDPEAAKELKVGDRVMIDGKGILLVSRELNDIYIGHESRLERRIDDKHIEITNHQDERTVVMAGPELVGQIEKGEVVPGAAIIVGRSGNLAIKALPAEEKLHFRFLDRGAVPDIIVDRDIGNPPKIIEQVAKHVREEMTRPELRRRFRLRPCITKLLCGVSGTGKTLAVNAIHRRLYQIMEEVTDTPIEKLPPRVFKFRTSQMLSMWLGESDKNIDRLFDEVEQLTERTFTNAQGKEYRLPVMVVMEEADGMGRARGTSGDSVYDRIQTTLLQRLDPNRQGLANKMVVVLSTTNEPQMIDPAFLRRIGGSVETFGRLDQKSFEEILKKHVAGLPATNGKKDAWKSIIGAINQWMFDPNVDQGIIQLTYQGHSEPVIKYRRDFLTPALIDRSVQDAATKAWEHSITDDPQAGITFEHMLHALNQQILSVAHQLHVQNVHSYLDIPEGVKVSSVKRIVQKQHANK